MHPSQVHLGQALPDVLVDTTSLEMQNQRVSRHRASVHWRDLLHRGSHRSRRSLHLYLDQQQIQLIVQWRQKIYQW